MDSKPSDYQILIVDDTLENLYVLHDCLVAEGYKVREAGSGEIALASVKLKRPDLILLDINMPEMDGFEVCRTLKENELTSSIPVIFLSALSSVEDKVKAFQLGGVDYITKPFEENEVLSRVRTHLENYEMKHHLEELVYERSSQLVAMEREKVVNFEESLFALVDLIESRDTYTGGHTQRVANYCKLIAEAMGYSEEECKLIYRAGILHDVGKVTTPDSVLLKPGALNDVEYELIKEHVVVGKKLLNKIPMYKELSTIICHHHERYDGRGYPDGLKADEIPPLSRIMNVADSFDAMTTSRIYKARKTIDEAVDELESLSGKQFDPQVVEHAKVVLKAISIDESINQKPKTNLEAHRFAYFYIDQLTHLHNKAFLEYILLHTDAEYKYSYAYGVYLQDFSNYNQEHSWDEGDKLLIAFADDLTELYPENLIFRLFGDDFFILSNEKLTLPDENGFESLKESGLSMCLKEFDLNEKIPTLSELENKRK